MAVIDAVGVIVVLVLLILGVSYLMTRTRTRGLSQENKRLRELNEELSKDEGTKVLEARAENSAKDDRLVEHDQLLDDLLAQCTEPLNPLDNGDPRQEIMNMIAARRPRRRTK